jgi:hypothetical protein
MQIVTWQPWPDDVRYVVSDRGQVRGPSFKWTGRELAGYVGKNGYRVVYAGGRNVYVHVMVLETFVGKCPPGQECRHLLGDKLDNRWPEAVAWGTPSQNKLDLVAHGRHHNANKTRCKQGHKFRVIVSANGRTRRYCPVCHGISSRTSYLRKHQAVPA